MANKEIECPYCERTFYPDECDPAPLDTEDAAERLLRNYNGRKPSFGDVVRLKERINEILAKEFNVGIGKL